MLLKSDLSIGDIVIFGKSKGEHTKAEVVKLNQKRAKVKTLEPRGINGKHPAGGLWNVPYSLLIKKAVEPAKPLPPTEEAGWVSDDPFSAGYDKPAAPAVVDALEIEKIAEKIKDDLFAKIRAGGEVEKLVKAALLEAMKEGLELTAAAIL